VETVELTTPAEWTRIKNDLINIVGDPKSLASHVENAFQCLCAITDRERTYATFPTIIDLLERNHPTIAARLIPDLPERFIKKDLILTGV
jgi:hypothetical protein